MKGCQKKNKKTIIRSGWMLSTRLGCRTDSCAMPGINPRGRGEGLASGRMHVLMALTVLRRGLSAGAILTMSLRWDLFNNSNWCGQPCSYLALRKSIFFNCCWWGQSYLADGKGIPISGQSTKQTKKKKKNTWKKSWRSVFQLALAPQSTFIPRLHNRLIEIFEKGIKFYHNFSSYIIL